VAGPFIFVAVAISVRSTERARQNEKAGGKSSRRSMKKALARNTL